LKTIIITLFLSASAFSLDITNASEISEYCQIVYEDGKFVVKNRSWCDHFIEMEARLVLAQDNEKWCLDSGWTATKWKSYFLSYTNDTSKSVRDVIRKIFNRKHRCPLEVI